jgi:CRISPR-associated endonuclease/helicase Cas3
LFCKIEHHSNIDAEKETEKQRLACENWDAPIIITTNVQFFESLYANKSSKCRKLHNIVNSIIILDEAQILPPELLYPVEDILRQLVDNYKCSIVFSTATQPYFENIKNIEKIIPDDMDLYSKLKRVNYHLPDKQETLEEIAEKLKTEFINFSQVFHKCFKKI